MIETDYRAPPLRWRIVHEKAYRWRDLLGLSDEPYLPIIDILEGVMDLGLDMCRFQIGSVADMGQNEGLTSPAGEFIRLREDVYLRALARDGRARFTAAHELGHFALHVNVPLARAKPGEEIPAYARAEPQANQFASAILMPEKFISLRDTEDTIAQRHGVSRVAAINRLQYLRNNCLPKR